MKFLIKIFLLVLFFSCNNNSDDTIGFSKHSPRQVQAVSEFVDGYNILARGFSIPWAIEAIGENEYLISERFGELYYYKEGEISSLENIPEVVTVSDRYLTYGGLMDVSLHPQFDENNLVYIAYVSAPLYNMKVARFKLENGNIRNLTVVFETNGFSIGSRIEWQDNEHFFVSMGGGGYPYPEPGSQNLELDVGKIHRLKSDGQIPEDNPILPGKSEPGSIWSYGHRDPQGLYFDNTSKTLYSSEHGPLGGDELNIILKGENYGWPLFSYGLNYDGTPVSSMTEGEADSISQLPIKYWSTAIAPSNLVKLQSSNFEELNGSFLMGSLSQQCIVQYDIESELDRKLWVGIGRVRDIAELPGGDLLVLVDKDSPNEGDTGRLIKLSK